MNWRLYVCVLLTWSLTDSASLIRPAHRPVLNLQQLTDNVQGSTRSRQKRQAVSSGCSATSYLVSDTQTISSPPDPNNNITYMNNAHCLWQLTAPIGQRIKLTMIESRPFRLESSQGCAYDYLAVHDGENENSLILGRYCGSSFPQSGIESTSNVMHVIFHSDPSLTDSGFQLAIEFLAPTVSGGNCGGTLGGDSGELNSPGFGTSNYPDNVQCTWVIDIGESNIAKLEFSAFNIEAGDNCLYDMVSVYDGHDKNGPKLGSFCGNINPGVIESTGKYLMVEFVSDNSITMQGFAATYTAVTKEEAPKETLGCDASRPAILTEAEGKISSPTMLPSRNYPDNSLCQWRIAVPAGKRAHLHIDAFSLEAEGSCQYDNLEIFDGADVSSKKLGRYCGNDIPGDITATGNVILVQFISDSSVTAPGFNITYSAKGAGGNTGSGNGNSDEPPCGIPEVVPKFSRIVGGTQAIPHSWPWQVTISRYRSHHCGGSVLSKRWVLTAAHCVNDDSASAFTITVGEHDLKDTTGDEQTVGVAAIFVHGQYNPNTYDSDIALLKLTSDIIYNQGVKPVCLPRGDAPIDMTCYTTGWGDTRGTGVDTLLNQVRVPIISRETCKKTDWYGALFTTAMFCAGYPAGGKDSCQGDSGGPLVCRENGLFRLQGITSWGNGCAAPKSPGIYTRVTRFVNWVDAQTSGAFQSPP